MSHYSYKYTLNYAIIMNNKCKIEIMNFLHKYLTLKSQNDFCY